MNFLIPFTISVFLLSLGLSASITHAFEHEDESIKVEPLKWVDEGFLARKRQVVEDIGRGEFGTRVRKDKSDLRLINRIIQKELVNQTQRNEQQALGVVFGDVLVKELNLHWRVYLDEAGKSRAVCIPNSKHCIFPVTMISKRMGYGRKPDAYELFEKAKSHLDPHLPKLPYTKKL